MTDISTDRLGNLAIRPAFLPASTPEERSLLRLAALIASFAVLASIFLLVASLVSPALAVALLYLGGESASYVDVGMRMFILRDSGVANLSNEVLSLAMMGGMFGALVGALLIPLRLIYDRPMRSWITSGPGFNWRLGLAGLVLFGAIWSASFVTTLFTDPATLHTPMLDGSETVRMRIAYAVAVLSMVPLAAAVEEVVFRGWMLQLTAAWSRNLVLIIGVSSIVFSLSHLDPDPGRIIARAAVGAAFAWSVLRLGGLEFGMGAHAMNNLAIALLVTTLGKAGDTAVESQLMETVVDLLSSVALVASVELVARWTPLRRWARLEA